MTAESDLADTIVAGIDALLTARAQEHRSQGTTEAAWLDALDRAADAVVIRAVAFRLFGLPDSERAAAFDASIERLSGAMAQRRPGILASIQLQEGCYGPA